ncbi:MULTISPECIES: hypothetical protein [unclassified Streptomyces]|uniref:hypothetical protein n=1 Tax=unclassified Streptomyces TaxID=2593676 RepID=UPI0033A9B2D6
MRRAGFVVAAATALTLGAAGTGRADTTATSEVTASWGDRVRLQYTWTDRQILTGGTLTVTDATCDDRTVYATLTVTTGAGRTVPLGDRHNTGGCGTTAEYRDITASDPSGVVRLTLRLCHPAPGGATATCETRYIGANPYRPDPLRF